MISKEDMEVLDGFEYSFKTAIENNYCHNLGAKKYNLLHSIYFNITGKKYAVNWGCPHCAIRFIKDLGKLYFAEKARQESEKSAANNQQVQKELEPNSVTPSESKKKGGRKKKEATNNELNTE